MPRLVSDICQGSFDHVYMESMWGWNAHHFYQRLCACGDGLSLVYFWPVIIDRRMHAVIQGYKITSSLWSHRCSNLDWRFILKPPFFRLLELPTLVCRSLSWLAGLRSASSSSMLGRSGNCFIFVQNLGDMLIPAAVPEWQHSKIICRKKMNCQNTYGHEWLNTNDQSNTRWQCINQDFLDILQHV